RRQHTRSKRDWSSDVCSSDLYFVTPVTYEQVQHTVKLANEEALPFTLLGNGSNLIIRDGGIRGIVMYLGKLADVTVEETKIIARSEERRVGKEGRYMHVLSKS